MTRPLLDPVAAGRLLDDVIFERICALIDVEKFDVLRRELVGELVECGLVDAQALHVARAMYEKAMLRLADRPLD